jgi:peptidoglycan hydrolase-like protein with peptidoglycan-binding domain
LSSSLRSLLLGLVTTLVAAGLFLMPTLAQADTPATTSPDTDAPTAEAASRLGTRALRAGDRGTAVKALQTLLATAGFATKADGRYGAGTVKVVRRFQRAAHLKVTGVASRTTLDALRRATNGSAARNVAGGFGDAGAGASVKHLGDRIPLQQGMSGRDVRILQDFLTRAGFATTIDGEFGAGTVGSMKAFETAGQRTVDGVVDAADIDALRAAVDGADAPAATTPAATAVQPVALTPGAQATLGPDKLAVAPASAPAVVQQIIAAGNAIAFKPYVYGGGHGTWDDRGYDCSGSVSYALHGAGLLDGALPSGDFMDWGEPGPGQWVTIYAKGSHMYMVVAGLRFDTSGRQEDGSRWHTSTRSPAGYTVVHPPGL